MSDQLAWLRLQLTPGLGRSGQFRLLNHYGQPTAVLASDPADWPLTATTVDRPRHKIPAAEAPEVVRAQEALERSGAWLMSFWDADYPELLRRIPDPPVLLYGRGQKRFGEGLAIVGARRPSPSGLQIAADLAGQIAGAGIMITSGLARGIDAAAHRGALAARGQTVAVLGCGIDRVYPPEHTRLFQEVAAQGTLLSEYPPGTPPLPGHFPGRNRIISGLCRGTLVVEAALGSGSLITADFALDQGRDVMAVPGNITQLTSAGTNQLIKQGATPVTAAEDILQLLWPDRLLAQHTGPGDIPVVNLSPARRAVLDLLDSSPRHIDSLLQESGLTLPELSDILLHLELQGFAEQLPGTRFVRGRKAIYPSAEQGESA